MIFMTSLTRFFLRKAHILFTLLCLLTNLNSGFAEIGGIGDGGGNILSSTKEQVINYITTIQQPDVTYNRIGLAADLHSFTEQAKNIINNRSVLPNSKKLRFTLQALEPQITQLSSMFKEKFPYKGSTYLTSELGLDIVEDESICDKISPHKKPDACYSDEKKKIYLILPRLMKYPHSLLPTLVFPLVVHEMVHKAKLDETQAVWLQNYISNDSILPECRFEFNFGPNNESIDGSTHELIRGRFEIKLNDKNIGPIFQTYDFTPNVSGIANGGYISNVYYNSFNENAKRERPKGTGELSYKINWEKDYAGQLEFESLDTVQNEMKVVKQRLIWTKPILNTEPPASMYGGYIASVLPGTEVTFKGRKFRLEKDNFFSLLMYGNCFPRINARK